jgi:hypothetical protein
MKTDSVEVTLESSRWGRPDCSGETENKSEHTFKIKAGNKELFLLTPDGQKVIARITVQTLTKDVKDEEGDYHTKPSKNFTICFEAEDDRVDKNMANAWLENIPANA